MNLYSPRFGAWSLFRAFSPRSDLPSDASHITTYCKHRNSMQHRVLHRRCRSSSCGLQCNRREDFGLLFFSIALDASDLLPKHVYEQLHVVTEMQSTRNRA